jgi:hypothetical protein
MPPPVGPGRPADQEENVARSKVGRSVVWALAALIVCVVLRLDLPKTAIVTAVAAAIPAIGS